MDRNVPYPQGIPIFGSARPIHYEGEPILRSNNIVGAEPIGFFGIKSAPATSLVSQQVAMGASNRPPTSTPEVQSPAGVPANVSTSVQDTSIQRTIAASNIPSSLFQINNTPPGILGGTRSDLTVNYQPPGSKYFGPSSGILDVPTQEQANKAWIAEQAKKYSGGNKEAYSALTFGAGFAFGAGRLVKYATDNPVAAAGEFGKSIVLSPYLIPKSIYEFVGEIRKGSPLEAGTIAGEFGAGLLVGKAGSVAYSKFIAPKINPAKVEIGENTRTIGYKPETTQWFAEGYPFKIPTRTAVELSKAGAKVTTIDTVGNRPFANSKVAFSLGKTRISDVRPLILSGNFDFGTEVKSIFKESMTGKVSLQGTKAPVPKALFDTGLPKPAAIDKFGLRGPISKASDLFETAKYETGARLYRFWIPEQRGAPSFDYLMNTKWRLAKQAGIGGVKPDRIMAAQSLFRGYKTPVNYEALAYPRALKMTEQLKAAYLGRKPPTIGTAMRGVLKDIKVPAAIPTDYRGMLRGQVKGSFFERYRVKYSPNFGKAGFRPKPGPGGLSSLNEVFKIEPTNKGQSMVSVMQQPEYLRPRKPTSRAMMEPQSTLYSTTSKSKVNELGFEFVTVGGGLKTPTSEGTGFGLFGTSNMGSGLLGGMRTRTAQAMAEQFKRLPAGSRAKNLLDNSIRETSDRLKIGTGFGTGIVTTHAVLTPQRTYSGMIGKLKEETLQEQKQKETREQKQPTRQIEGPAVYTPIRPRSSTPPFGMLETPKEYRQKMLGRKRRAKVFDVLVRRRGLFGVKSPRPIELGSALRLGKRITEGTLAASFKLANRGYREVEDTSLKSAMPDLSRFYKSRREPGVVIQLPKFRLGSLGERWEIKRARRK